MCWGRQATTSSPHPPLSLFLPVFCPATLQTYPSNVCRHTHKIYLFMIMQMQSFTKHIHGLCVTYSHTNHLQTNFTCLQLIVQNTLASHLSMAAYNIPSAPLWARPAWPTQPIHTSTHTHTSIGIYTLTQAHTTPPCLCREEKTEGTKEQERQQAPV